LYNSSVQNFRIYALCVLRVHGHKCLDDDAIGCMIDTSTVQVHPLHFYENADENLSAVVYTITVSVEYSSV